jgi:hypothetical protein
MGRIIVLDLSHGGVSCSASISAKTPLTPVYIGCLSYIDSMDTRVPPLHPKFNKLKSKPYEMIVNGESECTMCPISNFFIDKFLERCRKENVVCLTNPTNYRYCVIRTSRS